MPDDALSKALLRALLALRITLGLFLLQWGVEKFVVPQANIFIWSHFYGMDVSQMLGYAFGAAEIAIALCMILGQFRTVIYGAALILHAVTVLVTWRRSSIRGAIRSITCSRPACRCSAVSWRCSCCATGIAACWVNENGPEMLRPDLRKRCALSYSAAFLRLSRKPPIRRMASPMFSRLLA